jgi:hypothetical protein
MIYVACEKFSEQHNCHTISVDKVNYPLLYMKLVNELRTRIPFIKLIPLAALDQLMGRIVGFIFRPADKRTSYRTFESTIKELAIDQNYDLIEEVAYVDGDTMRIKIRKTYYLVSFLSAEYVINMHLADMKEGMQELPEESRYEHMAVIDAGARVFPEVREELSLDPELAEFFERFFPEGETLKEYERVLTFAFKERADRDKTVAVLNGQDPEDVPTPISVH